MGIFTDVWVTHLKMVSSKNKIASEIQYTFFTMNEDRGDFCILYLITSCDKSFEMFFCVPA